MEVCFHTKAPGSNVSKVEPIAEGWMSFIMSDEAYNNPSTLENLLNKNLMLIKSPVEAI